MRRIGESRLTKKLYGVGILKGEPTVVEGDERSAEEMCKQTNKHTPMHKHTQTQQDLFVCMLRNMFEEYKFFPQFPEKELQITGHLFGGIIEHGLVTYVLYIH